MRTNDRLPCSLPELGASWLLIWGEDTVYPRVWPTGWHRCFPHPFGGVECRGHAQYPAFAPDTLFFPPGSSEVAVWSFLNLFLFFKKIFIYLFIYLSSLNISWIMQDLLYFMADVSLQCSDSLAVVHGLNCSVTHGILVPQLGIEFSAPALQGVFLRAGPPGKSPDLFVSCCPWFAPTLPAQFFSVP